MRRLALSVMILSSVAAWAADQPGQRFLISPADLPRPGETPAVSNNPTKVARNGAVPSAPPGFKVTLFAENLTSARFLAVAPNGDVLLTERLGNKVTLLRDSNGDGRADQRFVFAEGLRNPSGIAVHDGYVYVSDQNAIWRTPYVAGANQAGKLERVTTAPDLRLTGMHGTRNFAFSDSGTLVLEQGSRDNVSDFQPGAKIYTVKDGALLEYASGLRNAVGIAFAPGTNDLFAAVNERDGLGDNLPPDYFTFVKPGGFYGYPYAYSGKNSDPEIGTKRPDLVAQSITPDVLFPAHSAPTGLVFYNGSQFPAQYKGDAFVSLHGSWNTSEPHGYKVVRVHMKNGRVDGHGFENFLTGFWDGQSRNPPQVWGRPVGLAVARDGALLVADDLGNAIWRVSYGK
jgi:glucose/arabinose dehydrogenase